MLSEAGVWKGGEHRMPGEPRLRGVGSVRFDAVLVRLDRRYEHEGLRVPLIEGEPGLPPCRSRDRCLRRRRHASRYRPSRSRRREHGSRLCLDGSRYEHGFGRWRHRRRKAAAVGRTHGENEAHHHSHGNRPAQERRYPRGLIGELRQIPLTAKADGASATHSVGARHPEPVPRCDSERYRVPMVSAVPGATADDHGSNWQARRVPHCDNDFTKDLITVSCHRVSP